MAYYNDYRTFGNRVIATEDNGQSATYNDLADFSAQIGKALPKRTLVFSFCENNIGSMFGYLSFLENRIVPLLLDNHIHQDLAEQLMEAYRPGRGVCAGEPGRGICWGRLRVQRHGLWPAPGPGTRRMCRCMTIWQIRLLDHFGQHRKPQAGAPEL